MCRSIRQGGQRCAAHTRPRYEAATFGTPEWDEAAAEYASTKSGRAALEEEASYTFPERAAALAVALRRGETLRESAAAVRAVLADTSADVDPDVAQRVSGIGVTRRFLTKTELGKHFDPEFTMRPDNVTAILTVTQTFSLGSTRESRRTYGVGERVNFDTGDGTLSPKNPWEAYGDHQPWA